MKLMNNVAFEGMIKVYEAKYNMSYRSTHLMLLRRGYELGFDISLYADPRFENEQLNIIFDGLHKGLDVKLYANIEMDSFQMDEIRDGLKEGLDMSICADAKFPWYVMHFTRICLAHNCETKLILDETLTFEQATDIINRLIPDWTKH